NAIEARSAGIRAALDRVSQKTTDTLQGRLTSLSVAGELFHPTRPIPSAIARLQNCPTPSDELHLNVKHALSDFTRKCEESVERQSRIFKEKVARIGDDTFSQAQSNAHNVVLRLETYFAQAEEIKSSIDESLANLARKTREAADAQTDILEESVGKITEQIRAVIDGRLDSVTSRVEGYRAQFEEISSALEAKLTSFIQTSEQAAQKQACLFDARIASTSEQAISLAHENLRTEIMRVQAR